MPGCNGSDAGGFTYTWELKDSSDQAADLGSDTDATKPYLKLLGSNLKGGEVTILCFKCHEKLLYLLKCKTIPVLTVFPDYNWALLATGLRSHTLGARQIFRGFFFPVEQSDRGCELYASKHRRLIL